MINRRQIRPSSATLILALSLLSFQVGLPRSFAGLSFTSLGAVPGSNNTQPSAISSDGTTIVGNSLFGLTQSAFVWTQATGFQLLSPLAGENHSSAFDVSGDGNTIVGLSRPSAASPSRAVRWQIPNAPEVLTNGMGVPLLDSHGVSQDGSTFIGRTAQTGYRISQQGAFALPMLSANHPFHPFGISNDGLTVAGVSHNSAGDQRAVRWSQTSGLQDLGVLPGFVESWAIDVSADGAKTVGWLDRPGGDPLPFQWTESTGMQVLALAPTYTRAQASGVSADGNVIVGGAINETGNRAWIWTPTYGMQDLTDMLAPVLPQNWRLVDVRISDDGNYLTGRASTGGPTVAWIATIPEPASGIVLLTGLGCCLLARRRKQTV